MTLREKVNLYYESEGINDRWIGFSVGKRSIKVFPLFIMPKPFRDWLKIHDAHHLITGYATDFQGEVEISAWVLARNGLNFGGKPKWLPFFVAGDTLFLAFYGLFIMPKKVLNAFKKGKAEYSLHCLDADRVLDLDLNDATRYITTGRLS